MLLCAISITCNYLPRLFQLASKIGANYDEHACMPQIYYSTLIFVLAISIVRKQFKDYVSR